MSFVAEYANSVDPAYWDLARSGAVSTALLKNPSTTLATASAARSVPLANMWDGGEIENPSAETTGLLFVLPTPAPISMLVIGHWSVGTGFRVVLWGETGTSLAATTVGIVPTMVTTPDGNSLYRVTFPSTTVISAFALVESTEWTSPGGVERMYGVVPARPYTDYTNNTAPSNWDATSGVLGEINRSAFFDGANYLNDIVALKTAGLASIWAGTEYGAAEGGNPLLEIFVFPGTALVSTMFFEVVAPYGSTEFVPYGPDGAPLRDYSSIGGVRLETVAITDPGPGGDTSAIEVRRLTLPVPTAIKAFTLVGVWGYPQGDPMLIRGIYGPQLAGAAPLPPPFWKQFRVTFESGVAPP